MSTPSLWIRVIGAVAAASLGSPSGPAGQSPSFPQYRIEDQTGGKAPLATRFTPAQLSLLEKLNRADVSHLRSLPELVVPLWWTDDELAYSVFPPRYASADPWPTFLVVHLPGQMFGAYESGRLVRWGPVSSGGPSSPTGSGRFSLNWRSPGRTSTVDPDWFMRWYFNFGNREGLAFHAYALPGSPASHGCIRLLDRDAEWLFGWGQTWRLEGAGRITAPGTPVLIVTAYDFNSPPPWRSLAWLADTVELPR